jgi:hypothetical protein
VITISTPKQRSFNSVHLDKNKETGDFSLKSHVTIPNRRIMDKIAMLETQMLAMTKKIE